MRVGAEVLVLGVAAPQPGARVDGDEAVHVAQAVALAAAVRAGAARVALAARLEDLDRHPVADLHAPALGRRRAPTASITPTDSWPGTKAKPAGERAGVLLVVGAAQAARLDAEQAVVVADPRGRGAPAATRCGATPAPGPEPIGRLTAEAPARFALVSACSSSCRKALRSGPPR